LSTGYATTIPVATLTAYNNNNKQAAPAKSVYKSVPDNYKVLSEAKYHKLILDLETVLLEISTDGIGFNTPDGRISVSTLKNWAEHLRDALETLSKAQ
jgi:hypothetical protein